MTSRSTRTLAFVISCCAFFALTVSISEAGTILPGQLVNIRVGDGTTAPAGTGLPVTLDVYTVTYTGGVPTGVTLSQSIALPTATSGTPPTSGNRYLTQGGTAAGEGGLTLSTDGNYMALGGYNNIVGGVTNGSGNSGQRVVGVLTLSTGTVDTTTDYADGPTASAIRNAFTTNGSDIWTANSTGGVRYLTLGGSTSTTLTSTGAERRTYVYNTGSGNQLYTSRQSGTVDGVATVGTGTPTSGTQTVTLLPGFPTTNVESAYDYWFADANTLYVGDDISNQATGTAGGLQKWILTSGTWVKQYNIQVNPTGTATKGIKSLAGRVDAFGNVTLFGASTDTVANYLYGFSDTLSNTSAGNVIVNQLVNASTAFTGAAWNLRGVAIAPGGEVPEPAAIALLALGSVLFVLRRRY
jgi:hypothetical protein